MKVLEYTALNNQHKVCRGELPMSDFEQIETLLGAQNLRLVQCRVVRQKLPKPLNYDQLSVLWRSLRCYMAAGLTISDALDCFLESSIDGHQEKVLKQVSYRLRSGELFSQSIKPFLPQSDIVSLNLLSMAEVTGSYAEVLEDVERYSKWRLRLQRTLKQSARYPIIVLSVMWGVLFCLLYMFAPQLSSYLQQIDVEIPLITKILLVVSQWVVEWPWIWGAFPFGVFVSIRLFMQMVPGIKKYVVYIPGLREIVLEYYYAVFSKVIALQLKHGYSLVESVRGMERLNSQGELGRVLQDISFRIMQGVSLTEALHSHPKYISKLLLQLMEVGERSNTVYENLALLSDHYDESLQNKVLGLIKLMEPFLLIIMGTLVAIFVIGLFYPLYQQMGQAISGGL